MHVNIQDYQSVSEVDAVIFELFQPLASDSVITLVNSGINTLNYHFQEYAIGASGIMTWVDLGAVGSTLNSALQASQSVIVEVASTNSKVRLMSNASGGSVIDFAVSRYQQRAAGAPLPVV